MMPYLLKSLLFAALTLLAAPFVSARLQVEITEGVEGGIPVAVIPFVNESQKASRTYGRIVASDLAYSGLFSLVSPAEFESLTLPTEAPGAYGAWHEKGIEKIVSGTVLPDKLQVVLFDVVQKKRLSEWSVQLSGASHDHIAHYVSDLVYEELTGMKGIFRTKIAFISSEWVSYRKRNYHLNISDADGYNSVSIFDSPKPLMTPSWAPDGKRIVYVSYENGTPQLFVQELETARRTNLSVERGLGSANAPDWSDDGSKIAFVSSQDGNPEIYAYDLLSAKVIRMTNSSAIDTEPGWAPNNTLYFTSDRSGSPQIYRIVPGTGNRAERITFVGDYNSDPDISPQGDKIAYASARGMRSSIVVRGLDTDRDMELSFGDLDERPRFAPNGQLLSYLTQDGSRSALGLITVDGVFGRLVPVKASYMRGIAWSPLPR